MNSGTLWLQNEINVINKSVCPDLEIKRFHVAVKEEETGSFFAASLGSACLSQICVAMVTLMETVFNAKIKQVYIFYRAIHWT